MNLSDVRENPWGFAVGIGNLSAPEPNGKCQINYHADTISHLGDNGYRSTSMINKQLFILAATIFVLSVTGSQANPTSPADVDKILAVLKAENCQIIRDAMGEKKFSVEGTYYKVEAECADEKSYTFTLDQNFNILDKKVHKD